MLRVRQLLVTAHVFRSSPILVILMMEAMCSYETLVLTRVTRRNIPEDCTLHSHRLENLESYMKIQWIFSPTISGLRVLHNESKFLIGVSLCGICPRGCV
jgi:hypothetical protein